MSNTINVTEEIALTWFWGGDKKGRCLQITKNSQYVELTLGEMIKLIKIFIKEERDKYPKRKRKCLGCGRA